MDYGVRFISADSAIQQIVGVIKNSETGEAPFVCVVGAGFSAGLVPTTQGIVFNSLPTLDKTFVRIPFQPKPFRSPYPGYSRQMENKQQEAHIGEEQKRRAISFWKRFLKENESRCANFTLSDKELPENIPLAYKLAFDEQSSWPFASKSEAHKFLNKIMRPDVPRLNAALFFLASILGSQPNAVEKNIKSISKNSSLFKFESAFSRLILTTNFDPFLQVALQ